MKVCNTHHESIVIDGTDCPLCEARREISMLEDMRDTLSTRVDELREEVRGHERIEESLREEIESLKREMEVREMAHVMSACRQ